MKEKSKEFDSNDVFNKWLNFLKKDGFSRYSNAGRAPQIEVLAEMLIEFNIDFEDAKMLKNKAIQILMTEKGYKKKDKHSNGVWLKHTEMDFDRIIADYYLNYSTKTPSQYEKEYKQDPEIVAWAVGKFGKNVSPKVLKDCHTIGNSLFFWFVEDLRKG